MSDFDEEAERRRLREKFDRDREKRQETARMSELLLKGATMTNQHCERCGDPIFRYRGQEFCPTCAGGAADATAADGIDDAAQSAQSGEAAAGESSPSVADVDATSTDSAEAGTATDGSATEADAAETTERQPDSADGSPTGRRPPSSTPAQGAETPSSAPSPSALGGATDVGSAAGGDDHDLDAARASLVRTLTRHARRAEELDDPRRATEHLGVVREAAEALAAVDETR